ncbi:alanine--glyoxylate aminotransferase family protein [Clostridium sp. CMCC3677]|uniref:pyridoxal-phosphate-dependent aminotransferase family protein n=1 Tax=Clostridium sp. CMCC3677 TaxID=2949963 RepID=UPI0013F0512F|nr:alanine--glyoxylate aminotransferase family protein [Clostridium sp. CMCC3677]NFG63349.1 alanine--glyoxylate aminotransferase family protein [Clostridium botulinum]NFQ10985.1 alanine--glyoxylate aminotransferase family protein [Clostridium botulinum]
MHKKLFIPGPVEVREDVLEKMATPMIGHRSKDASILQRRISDNLRKLFYTNSEILLSTTSGSGLMEGAIRCCTAKRAAVFSVGAFGKRWYDMAVNNNVPADLFSIEMGQAIDLAEVEKALSTGKYDLIAVTHNETSTGVMNPVDKIGDIVKKYPDVVLIVDTVSSAAGTKIEVDKWGIDVCITSSQKALGLPPGLSVCTFSQKAKERAEKVPSRGYYLDLLKLYQYIQKKDYQYPSTPSLSHMFALDYQLDNILNKEGLENRFARHLEMAKIVRAWAKKYFDIFPDENHLSNTLTTIKNTRGINVADLNKELGKRGFQISNGYGDLKEKTFRIAHMADCSVEDVKELLKNIEEILGLC